MQQSTINEFVNPDGHRNATHVVSMLLGRRCGKFGWWNLRHWFAPPKFISVVLLPNNLDYTPVEEFELEMFLSAGFLYNHPLNHFIRLTPQTWIGKKAGDDIYINSGFLGNQFIVGGNSHGYAVLAQLIKDETFSGRFNPPTAEDSAVQAEGTAKQEGNTSGAGGDST